MFSATGIWLGTLTAGAMKLRVQFHLDISEGVGTFDSLDQGAKGIACSSLKASPDEVSFAIPAILGRFRGAVAPDGETLTGVWHQGMDLPLVLQRQREALEVPAPAMDEVLDPVPLRKLREVLTRDLAEVMRSGLLAPAQQGGVALGVALGGERLVLAYGEGRADALYEIGSVTKTFTGLMLAQMVEQGRVRLDTPVRELLPAGTVTKPASGREITLLDLSRQHSGLPRMPGNFHPANRLNPYADYDGEALYAFMAQQGVGVTPEAGFAYSNLGVGLLGQALANGAGMTYAELLREQVTGPLGMEDTVVALTPVLRARMAQGHNGEHQPAGAWDLDALAGAGGIRSTAGDMLTYLEAQLHPDRLPATAEATAAGRTLSAALRASQVIQGESWPGMHIALNWFCDEEGAFFWHNGATGGFSSHASFDGRKGYAVVILCNTAASGFTDKLGAHVAQRLEGKPAVSMNDRV